MSGFFSEAEKLGQDFSSGDSQQSGGLEQQAEKDIGQDVQGDSSSGSGSTDNSSDSSSSGGGIMSNIENQGKSTMINQEVNGFLTKEGVPSGADNTIDGFVDTEANKFF